MSYIDQAIVKYWDFIAPIGVEKIRRDAQLILDGTPCNEARGWYGEKPGCTRDKTKSAEKKAAKKANKTATTAPKKAKETATVSKKTAAKNPKVAGEKIAEAIEAKGVELSKVSPKKVKAAVDKNPKTASLPDEAKQKIVEKIVSPESKDNQVGNSGFSGSDGIRGLEKRWENGLKEAAKYEKYHTFSLKLDTINTQLEAAQKLEDGKEYKIAQYTGNGMEVLSYTKQERIDGLLARKAKAESMAAEMAKDLDPDANPGSISDTIGITEELIQHAKRKGVKSGTVEKDGKAAAAFAYTPKKDHIYIDFLVTNPENLMGKTKQKGAGVAALKEIVARSIKEGHGGKIKLTALDRAIPFYEKMGFTREDSDENDMVLSAEAAQKLLSR